LPASHTSGPTALTAAGTLVSMLAPVASAALTAAAAAAVAGGALLPPIIAALASAGFAAAVFLFRQAVWLSAEMAQWAALAASAGPRAAAWLGQQAWPHIQHAAATLPAAGSTSSLGVLLTGTTGRGSPASLTAEENGPFAATYPAAIGQLEGEVTSPAAHDLVAAQFSPSGPSANHSTTPPSLGGPGFRVWAPAAGRRMAASFAAVAVAPLALLLQWPATTATILFEVVMWVITLMMGAPLAVCLGFLSYVGLLPRSAVRPVPAAAMYSSSGLGPGSPVQVQATAPSARPAAQAPAGAMYTDSVLSAAQLPSGRAASTAGMEASTSALPLSATVVPEEHEGVHVDDKVVSPRGAVAVVRPVPPTPAPSMEVSSCTPAPYVTHVAPCVQTVCKASRALKGGACALLLAMCWMHITAMSTTLQSTFYTSLSGMQAREY
jgi:hypothetical protein